jgi:magnesium-transporting ATPase (P-type)
LQIEAGSRTQAQHRQWHASEGTEVLLALGSGPQGLDQPEGRRRLKMHGPNRLSEVPPPRLLVRLVRQFNNLLLIVLMVASVVTVAIGHWVDGAVIAFAFGSKRQSYALTSPSSDMRSAFTFMSFGVPL